MCDLLAGRARACSFVRAVPAQPSPELVNSRVDEESEHRRVYPCVLFSSVCSSSSNSNQLRKAFPKKPDVTVTNNLNAAAQPALALP